jgi:hypothetical protein
MGSTLFTGGDNCDLGYRNIRDAKDGRLYSTRHHCEYLWIFFERHADPEFRLEFRTSFNARYWEMYFTTTLILSGYEVTCPKPGPDVGIVHRGNRIWFECVSPTPGHPESPDYVARPKQGEAQEIPNEKMVLRYLNSISEKYERQYANWLARGYVSKDDGFVIAINPRNISFEYADSEPPRILQAAYTVGPLYVVIDRATGSITRTGYHFRGDIEKSGKADAVSEAGQKKQLPKVTTGVFQDRKHNGLSALLCSRVDAANRLGEMGDDFQLAPNPHASVALPQSFRLRGTYYDTKIDGTDYHVTPVTD